MKYKNNYFFIVDAFTTSPFSGNPAAVFFCNDKQFYSNNLLMNIASEFNLSETAFILPKEKQKNLFYLRWFTPTNEVDLCGHATLATSCVLYNFNISSRKKPITFYTKNDILKAFFVKKEKININNKNFDINIIKLQFPIGKLKNYENDDQFLLKCFENSYPKEIYYDKTYYLLVFDKEEDIINLKPDYEIMKKAKRPEFICTAISNSSEYDFISRFFAPGIGINEDPVTGSAHTYLANYWSKKLNKNELRAYQASKRGGKINIQIEKETVFLEGGAYIVAKGIYCI